MKAIKISLWLFALSSSFFTLSSCHKVETPGGSGSTGGPTMSVSVNGNNVGVNASVSSISGYTVMQGTSNSYTVQLWLTTGNGTLSGTYNLGASTTGYYGLVTDAFNNTFVTNANNIGQVTISGSAGSYSGNFSFTADESSPNPGQASVSITNGTFSNM